MISFRPAYPPPFRYPTPRAPSSRYQQQPQALLTGSDPNFSNQWWYPDSGASHHVTPDASNLSDSVSLPGTDQVYMGNGQGLNINSVGSMNLTLPNTSLTLHNLLLVPHITKNLISVSKFAQDNNVFFEFHPQFCLVKSQASSEVLLHGTVGADGLYKFANPASSLTKSLSSCTPSTSSTTPIISPCHSFYDVNCKPNSVATSNCISLCNTDHLNKTSTSVITPVTTSLSANNSIPSLCYNVTSFISNNKYHLWHNRLGHPHHHALAEVLKIYNIPTPSKPPNELCPPCCLGKSHRLPSSLSTTEYHHPFELVVCDL